MTLVLEYYSRQLVLELHECILKMREAFMKLKYGYFF